MVNIAFGDYSGGITGHGSTDDIIREGVTAIHAAVSDTLCDIL